MIKSILLFFTFITTLTITAQDCSLLLQQGIRSQINKTLRTTQTAKIRQDICDAYNQFKSDNSEAKASAKYKQIFKGSGSYSREQIETIGKLYCSSSSADLTNILESDYAKSYIDPEFSAMYQACLKAPKENNINLRVDPQDDKMSTVTINASFAAISNNRPKVVAFHFDSSKLDVTGTLLQLVGKELYGVPTLVIRRKDISIQPFIDQGDSVYATAGQMTLEFETGSFVIKFPKIEASRYEVPAPVPERNIGEVVASMLTKNEFLQLYGDNWALADGSPTPSWCAYKAYNDSLPDLRGVFLRGKNYDRNASTGNPDGDAYLGVYQKDELLSHNHKVTAVTYVAGQGEMGDRAGYPNKELETTAFGGNETRPRNVTVNYFIKIN